ncbi:hypothetical protein BS47DRAFT_1287188 [Hydnum rufescens UP504]|uniref:Histone-lysine N-methyltransferase n=1 Tax=Hydnum rufescens UP504 TaxID=1448309 RepID=A0A9P6B9U2_9AGAM|nr:hypothetical protein BS47DRAFT_1287188 [Hydnum rufescens UP504]
MVPELVKSGQAFCYNPDGTLKGYLEKTVIIECNSDCLCDDNCVNRTIQQGRKIKINLEKTKKKGWGVFAKQNIKAGTFVGIYAGELVKEEEAERRGMRIACRLYGVLGRTYMFDIDFGHLSEFSPADREILYAVDAFHVGNHTRFLNHSCEPNCYIVAAYIEEPDIERPFLAIFTSSDVRAGHELTFDYAGGPKKDESEGEKLAVYAKCECGARGCRGYMFT